jgi:hypothetical protein
MDSSAFSHWISYNFYIHKNVRLTVKIVLIKLTVIIESKITRLSHICGTVHR